MLGNRASLTFILALAAPLASATVLYGPTSLPGSGTCTNGTISWYSDPQQGQVFKTQVSEVDTAVSNSERCELAMGQGIVADGQTIYVGWKSKVVTPVSSSWNGIYQAKCHGTHVADQPLVWNISNGRMTLENHEDIGGAETSRVVWSGPSIPSGWFSVLMKVHYSESRTAGYVQLWYNGTLQTLANGTTIHYGQTWDGSDNNMHWGIYRRSSINGMEIHYVWRPRVATTQAEADPGGGTSPTPTPTPTPTPVPAATPTPTPTPTPAPTGSPIEITPGAAGVTASTHDGNVPANTVDNNLSTRWSASGDGQWLQYDLGATRTVSLVKIAWYGGNARRASFDVLVSGSATGPWTTALGGAQSSGTTTALETYDFADRSGRYLRVLGHGNSVNAWNSAAEVEIWGY